MISISLNPARVESVPGEVANRRTLALVFLYFVIAGAATVMLGPALPLLGSRWALGDAQLGTLFVASYLGQVCGAWLAARRPALSLLLGAAASGSGFLLLATSGFGVAHLLLFLIGLGLGAGLTAGNVVVGTMEFGGEGPQTGSRGQSGQPSKTRLLAMLNVSWGVGAIACPLWLRASLSLSRASAGAGMAARQGELFLLGLGAAFAGVAMLMLWLLPLAQSSAARGSGEGEGLPWGAIWAFVLTMMLYVGVENALAGWLPTYAQRLRGTVPGGQGMAGADWGFAEGLTGMASSIALCFWISQLAGRGLMAAFFKPGQERRLYRGCLCVLLGAVLVLVAAPQWSAPGILLLTTVVALSLGPLFPLAVSFLLARTGSHPQLGRVFATSSLGGSVLPWLTGVLSAHFLSLRTGFVVPGIGAALLLLLSARVTRTAPASR